MLKTQSTTRTLFGNRSIVFFGRDTLNAGMNMAVDEALMMRSAFDKKFYLRFYDFERPSIILSRFDPHTAIKNADGADVCRRLSGGRPLYMDQNMLGYTVTGPMSKETLDLTYSIDTLHRVIGPMLAGAISEIIENGHEVTLGGSSSIRVDNRRIVGNAYAMGHSELDFKNSAFIYHGVVVTAPWNGDLIGKLLNLTDEDCRQISSLPNLRDLSVEKESPEFYKKRVIEGFVGRFPKSNFENASESDKSKIFEEANELYKSRYSQSWWIYNQKVKPDDDVRFCILYED